MIPATPNAGAIHHHRAIASGADRPTSRRADSKTGGDALKPSPRPVASQEGTMRQRKSVRKSVQRAAVATSQRISGDGGKRGMLVKKGHVLRTHKERLFVLQDATLRYYRVRKADGHDDDPDALQLKGALQLNETDVITPTKGSELWFRIRKLTGPDGKTYKLDLKGTWHP
jgi:hypothetical protein